MSLSNFGRALAVGDSNGDIYLWDTVNGQRIATFSDPHSGGVHAVAFPPDTYGGLNPHGAILAASDNNGHVYLWDVVTRQLVATFTDPHSLGVLAVAFSPATMGATAGILAAADANGHVYLWNTRNGKLVATLTDPHARGAWSVAFGPLTVQNSDGAALAVRDENGNTYLWDIASRRMEATFADAASEFNPGVALNGYGTLATVDSNGRVYLWNIAAKRKAATLANPGGAGSLAFYGMAFSRIGILAVNKCGGHVDLWSLETKHKIATFTNPYSNSDYSVAVSSDSSYVAISHYGSVIAANNCDGHVYLWHLRGAGNLVGN